MIGTIRRTVTIAPLPATVLLVAMLAGCSGSSSLARGSATYSGTASVTPGPATVSPGEQFDRTVEVSVRGRTVTPAPGRVTVSSGDRVRILVTSDVANTMHVHGVDVEKDVPAGTATAVDVTMGESGVYEVEMHHPALLLFQFVVR